MYASVSWQKVRPGALKDLARAAKEKAPDISKAPGLVGHYVVYVGPDKYLTISLFEEAAHANAWARTASEHLNRAGLRKYLDDAPGATGRVTGSVVSSTP
jgi:heme-degrading monooxygenase HmoA